MSLGQNDYDFQADMWSIGCILAELLRSTSAYNTCNKRSSVQSSDDRTIFGSIGSNDSAGGKGSKVGETELSSDGDSQLCELIETILLHM